MVRRTEAVLSLLLALGLAAYAGEKALAGIDDLESPEPTRPERSDTDAGKKPLLPLREELPADRRPPLPLWSLDGPPIKTDLDMRRALRLPSLEDPRADPARPLAARGRQQWRIDLLPYCGYVKYDASPSKDYAHVAGVYGYLGHGPHHLLEAEADYTHIVRPHMSSLRQYDTTLVYSNFSIPHWKLRGGLHYIKSDDDPTDNGWTCLAGLHYYESGKWGAGADAYFSRYKDFNSGLDVFQVSPHLGINLLATPAYTLRNDASGHWIRLSKDVSLDEKDFFSFQDRLSLHLGPWSYGVFGWVGEQTFAVRNGGFTVLNLAEKREGGYGLDVRCVIGNGAAITLRTSREHFSEFGSRRNSTANTVVVLVGLTF